MPTTQEANILEAQKYANHLKQQELQAEGLDLEVLKKLKKDRATSPNALTTEKEEEPINTEQLDVFSKSFKSLEVHY